MLEEAIPESYKSTGANRPSILLEKLSGSILNNFLECAGKSQVKAKLTSDI